MVRDYKRYIRFLKTFEEKVCPCGEVEPHRLSHFPDNSKIHSLIMTNGKGTAGERAADELIKECRVLCKRCEADLIHSIKTDEDPPFILAY